MINKNILRIIIRDMCVLIIVGGYGYVSSIIDSFINAYIFVLIAGLVLYFYE